MFSRGDIRQKEINLRHHLADFKGFAFHLRGMNLPQTNKFKRKQTLTNYVERQAIHDIYTGRFFVNDKKVYF